jgi:hypothetical protein
MKGTTPDLLEVFNTCVEAIETRQATIAKCLDRYANIDGLEPLLLTLETVESLPRPALSRVQKDVIARQLVQQLKERPVRPQALPTQFSVAFSLAIGMFVLFCIGLFLIAQATSSASPASQPLSTTLPTLPTLPTIVTTPADAPVSIEVLAEKTKACLVNPRQFNSFRAKLNVKKLNAFINEVRAQSGKKLKESCAPELIQMATALMQSQE